MRQLGDYTLTHRLGVGGMGEVWKGRREALGGAAVDVAIKVLAPQRANDPEARRMFFDEARLSMLLSNSNIVKVFDVAETEDQTCYMVMEWVDGLNLSELCSKLRKHGERLPDEIIAYVVGELLKGLAHAHELRHEGQLKCIVHRDVSPHNSMISVHGEVKIMDFGVARIASEDTSGVHVKGKLRYMPPEQLKGETREPTLDLFSVGAILHELLDGEKFRSKKGVDEGRMFGMIFAGEVPPMKRPPHTIPPELEQLRQRLLAPLASDRIQSAREAFRTLTRWPGYRDARFELDEIVRRFAGAEHGPGAAPPPAALPDDAATNIYDTGSGARVEGHVAQTSVGFGPAGAELGPRAPSGSLPASPSGPQGGVSGPQGGISSAAMVASEGSNTDISRTRDSRTAMLAATAPRRERGMKIAGLVLGLCFLGFIGLGTAAALGLFRDELEEPETEDRSAVADATPEPEPEQPAPEPPTPEPPTPEPEPEPEDELILEEEPESETTTDEVEDTKPDDPGPAVKKSKVAVILGAGVPWAEIKLGQRRFELDAFSTKRANTRLAPGRYGVSYRTKVDGAWKQAGRIAIPAGSATVTLKKGGVISVQ